MLVTRCPDGEQRYHNQEQENQGIRPEDDRDQRHDDSFLIAV
jgi:hypothetical protein